MEHNLSDVNRYAYAALLTLAMIEGMLSSQGESRGGHAAAFWASQALPLGLLHRMYAGLGVDRELLAQLHRRYQVGLSSLAAVLNAISNAN